MNSPRQKWIWISGWGVPTEWFKGLVEQAIPDGEHSVVPPTAQGVRNINWREYDSVGGYSLGAFLLLCERKELERPALLLSPFFGYTSEMGFGGAVGQVQVQYLKRWVKREPLAALTDFYARAKLPLGPPADLPYPLDDLLWGLDRLAHDTTEPQLPPPWSGLIGAKDPFLDSRRLCAFEPKLKVVQDAGHAPAPLLASRPNQPPR